MQIYFINRYKGNGTSDVIARAASFAGIKDCSLPDCSISQATGDVTITSIPLDYEGWYTCKKSGNAADFKPPNDLHNVHVYVNGKVYLALLHLI